MLKNVFFVTRVTASAINISTITTTVELEQMSYTYVIYQICMCNVYIRVTDVSTDTIGACL